VPGTPLPDSVPFRDENEPMTAGSTLRRVTTSDIAREAGVSRATVSHILNNHTSKYSPETEARVMNALKALNYRPSMGGRTLATGKSDILVLVLPHATYGFRMQDAVDEVVAGAAELGASVLTRFAGPDHKSTIDALHYISPLAVMDMGGLGPQERMELEAAGVAVIPSTAQLSTSHANPDSLIGQLQVDTLLQTKERIVFAHLKDARAVGPSAHARAAAVSDACLLRGVEAPGIISVELSADSAANVLEEILSAGPVGIACYNDDVATAILAGATRLGYKVPQDVAVIGVDVTPLGQMLNPPLTSIDIDVPSAMEANLRDLRKLLGKPQPHATPLSSTLVQLHLGGTA
jgi:DNA-binding LacI/PurR family transcriptional regulator